MATTIHERSFKNKSLVAAESLTQIQQAQAIGKAIGRPVRFEELSPGQFRQVATQHFPAPVVEDLLKALASYVGQTAYMTADLEKIIGRPPTSYAQWAVQHADAYRSSIDRAGAWPQARHAPGAPA